MRLLLTSAGLRNKKILTALQDLVKRPFDQLNLAFISTAANLEVGDKRWLIKDLEKLSEIGFKEIDIVDVSSLPSDVWRQRLETADIIFFEAGNAYFLMYWLNKSGLGKLLPTLLKKKVYIGVSAGSIVVSPTIILSSEDKREIFIKNIKNPSNTGLGLVDLYVKSHVNSKYFSKRTFDYVEKLSKKVKGPVYALDDNSAVKVDGKVVTVVSMGEWKKFN